MVVSGAPGFSWNGLGFLVNVILTFVESSSASFIVAGTAAVGSSEESVTLVGPWLTAEGGDIDLVGVDWVRGDDSVYEQEERYTWR